MALEKLTKLSHINGVLQNRGSLDITQNLNNLTGELYQGRWYNASSAAATPELNYPEHAVGIIDVQFYGNKTVQTFLTWSGNLWIRGHDQDAPDAQYLSWNLLSTKVYVDATISSAIASATAGMATQTWVQDYVTNALS